MRTALGVLLVSFALIASSCTPLTLRPADFSWPVEEVQAPDGNGTVTIKRYDFQFNAKPLLFEELKDSVHVTHHALRVIRDQDGYYFMTAKDFKNVYVFTQGEGSLKLEKKIEVSEKGLDAPAMNQRPPFIQLVNADNAKAAPVLLSRSGVEEGGK